MFNLSHILYIIISLVLTVGILAGGYFIKNQKYKDLFLKFWALATFVLHISIMWVDFLKNGRASAPDYVLFPIYFCNLCMYALMVVAFIKNKNGKAFKWIATFVAWGGFFGAMITLFGSDYLANDPEMLQYVTIKSMLSHSTMLIGCLYLFVGGYIKVRVKNLIPLAIGLCLSGLNGLFINGIFYWCGLKHPNSMYLTGPIVSDVPFLIAPTLAAIMLVLVFGFASVYELFACKKGERWYNSLATTFKRKKAEEK